MVKTYRFNSCEDGERSVCYKVMLWFFFDTILQVLQALVLLYLDYCPVIWWSAPKKYLVKLQMAQNRAARLALNCNQRANINTMHASLNLLRVEESLTASLVFIRRTCHHGSFQSPQVQIKFKEMYTLYTEASVHGTPILYSASEQQMWFQKTNKATLHGTTPIPHVTLLLCLCTDMYV
jgi:hypothetical protein